MNKSCIIVIQFATLMWRLHVEPSSNLWTFDQVFFIRTYLNRFICFINLAGWFWARAPGGEEVLVGQEKYEKAMSRPSSQPGLTPQFCFNTTALQDFLRISRSSIDDLITQNLNALVTPARAGFDPSSTAPTQHRSTERRLIDATSCQHFKDDVLLPSWQTRSDVLNYCAVIATSPDPDDPESVLRQAETAHDRERIVDERLDPYSARYFPREARTEVLTSTVRNERGVENIIRERTWRVVGERCGASGETWNGALNRWRREREGEKR